MHGGDGTTSISIRRRSGGQVVVSDVFVTLLLSGK